MGEARDFNFCLKPGLGLPHKCLNWFKGRGFEPATVCRIFLFFWKIYIHVFWPSVPLDLPRCTFTITPTVSIFLDLPMEIEINYIHYIMWISGMCLPRSREDRFLYFLIYSSRELLIWVGNG